MTATDELRRLLDERGVEWRKTPHYSSESQDNETIFEGNGIEWYAGDHLNGRLGLRALRYEVTPEQAVEATLGSDLKAENAKLREQGERLFDKTLELATENAKLRELVKAAWQCILVATDGHEGHWFTGEEIVRCRDCKRFSLDNSDHDYRSGWWCHRWNTDMVKPDGFCAWGKKN